MNDGTLNIKFAEVNGPKPKSLRTKGNVLYTAKEPCKDLFPYTALKVHYIDVFSDDFAAVDVREELCYHSLTEKANSRGTMNGKNQ